jgi:hypothetical protein
MKITLSIYISISLAAVALAAPLPSPSPEPLRVLPPIRMKMPVERPQTPYPPTNPKPKLRSVSESTKPDGSRTSFQSYLLTNVH